MDPYRHTHTQSHAQLLLVNETLTLLFMVDGIRSVSLFYGNLLKAFSKLLHMQGTIFPLQFHIRLTGMGIHAAS